MLRAIVFLFFALFLTSCTSMNAKEIQNDQAICTASRHTLGSEAFRECMDARDQQRADKHFRETQHDIDEYDRLKQDRINEQLSKPVIR